MASKSNYSLRMNGYIYSKGTSAGFARMQRLGIPRPLYSLQDKLASILRSKYRVLVRQLLRDLKAKCAESNIVMDAAPEDDTLESLLKFFDEMGKKLKEENEEMIARVNLNTISNTLEHEWLQEQETELPEFFVKKIDNVFAKEQADYLKRLIGDADQRTAGIIQSFSIDKKQFFEDNMKAVRTLYLENSIDRIKGEESEIKKKIIQKIIDYANGTSDTLELADLVKAGYEGADRYARLFARDQMQRFNKACTIATFKSAAVTKVKWVTCNDIRVRKTHKALNGQVFDVNNLPKEVDDYNCRCGLVPVEWADD
ncbi:MAG: minor capsid protein [Bacteroidaceae bacterium]|nr:minor capsid protein [Bacteroidaceae bacterium]